MPMPPEFRRALERHDWPEERLRALGAHYQRRSAALQMQQADMWRRVAAARGLHRLPRRFPTPEEVRDYVFDGLRRSILFLDVLRRRGNEFLEYEASGQPPLLAFDYEILSDGRELPQPVNYCLVRIVPPEGVTVDPGKRPYLIIDPRAGHGAGIGGFKQESQVGVALREGNPVYFAVFFPEPEPGQTLAAVAAAESHFVREVARRHPHSPKPAIVGNCQGGWAAMGLAAADPEITGPLVLNGAPLSYWAGIHGRSPMRYLGGLAGGSWPAYLLSDLGNGKFDGVWLVQNFEALNPGNTLWTKYYNLYARIDAEVERFLDFEKWWGGFVQLNGEEMRSIVDDLFVGNKLVGGGIPAGRGTMLDLRRVRSPTVVFCSHGDDITPPQQALNWIADTYLSARDIKVHGQTIVYIIHADTGHLGIFVSGSVVRREFSQIAGTLAAIEALPPGLYELTIDDAEVDERGLPQYEVHLHEREVEDLLCHDDTREDERMFRVVAAISELNGMLYELWLAPAVRAASTELSAHWMRRLHPLRMQRYLWSDLNPFLWWLEPLAQTMRHWPSGLTGEGRPTAQANAGTPGASLTPSGDGNVEDISPVRAGRSARHPATGASGGNGRSTAAAASDAGPNPLWCLQEAWSQMIVDTLDTMRDMRDAVMEDAFHAVYGWLELIGVGERLGRRAGIAAAPEATAPGSLPLDALTRGGVREAVVRMLMLLMKASGSVRRETLGYVQERLREAHLFADTDGAALRSVVNTQSAIVAHGPEQALEALPALLPTPAKRREALRLLREVLPDDVLARPALAAALDRFEEVLEERQFGT